MLPIPLHVFTSPSLSLPSLPSTLLPPVRAQPDLPKCAPFPPDTDSDDDPTSETAVPPMTYSALYLSPSFPMLQTPNSIPFDAMRSGTARHGRVGRPLLRDDAILFRIDVARYE
ncbi:hypothetical protein CVT25_005192 [Psilocybe cyanescens]|uniref:Uncharacterized protein n=1 Tax=Psilocybe cyanescens TaxID=93625 RepID=A0A409W407_PSICY|nr:hypothetical protein CVT25_005192 [Psilocybe cyanescens]